MGQRYGTPPATLLQIDDPLTGYILNAAVMYMAVKAAEEKQNQRRPAAERGTGKGSWTDLVNAR